MWPLRARRGDSKAVLYFLTSFPASIKILQYRFLKPHGFRAHSSLPAAGKEAIIGVIGCPQATASGKSGSHRRPGPLPGAGGWEKGAGGSGPGTVLCAAHASSVSTSPTLIRGAGSALTDAKLWPERRTAPQPPHPISPPLALPATATLPPLGPMSPPGVSLPPGHSLLWGALPPVLQGPPLQPQTSAGRSVSWAPFTTTPPPGPLPPSLSLHFLLTVHLPG